MRGHDLLVLGRTAVLEFLAAVGPAKRLRQAQFRKRERSGQVQVTNLWKQADVDAGSSQIIYFIRSHLEKR